MPLALRVARMDGTVRAVGPGTTRFNRILAHIRVNINGQLVDSQLSQGAIPRRAQPQNAFKGTAPAFVDSGS